jgi:hypothetical protein
VPPLGFFLHVPSCGGTTFWSILRAAYGRDQVSRIAETDGIPREVFLKPNGQARPFRGKRLIGGHVLWTDVQDLYPDRRFVTFLRDPVERLTSQYFRQIRNRIWTPVSDDPAEDLNAYLPTQRIAIRQWFGSDETTADAAFALLRDRFAGFGVMEEFDRSVHLVLQALGLDTIPGYVQRNSGGNKTPLPDSAIAVIQSYLAEDIRFYDLAKAEFERRWNTSEFAADPDRMAQYKAANKAARQALLAAHDGRDPYVKGARPK